MTNLIYRGSSVKLEQLWRRSEAKHFLFLVSQTMAALTDHPYASLTLPDDAAADCLFLRPGLPGGPSFLLHRGGGDLPNSQEVREGKSPIVTNQNQVSPLFLVGGRRGTSIEVCGWGCYELAKRGCGSGFQVLLPSPHPPCRHCRSFLMSLWSLCPAQNWRKLAPGSAPSA